MRVLLSTTSGAGHFRPLLPFARALQRAGHEVACAAPEEAAAMVEREGLRHLAFAGVPGDHPDRVAVMGQVPRLEPAAGRLLFVSEIFGRLNTTYALPGARAAVEDFAPDLVVHETAELGVRLAAEAAGVPAVSVSPSLAFPDFVTSLAAGVLALRTRHGLDPDPEGELMMRGPRISLFPAAFDLPSSDRGVRRFRDPDLPAPADGGDLVYVTFGTEAPSMPFFAGVLREATAGALSAGRQVLVATGAELDAGVLDGLDGDLRVERWVDQAEVLRQARVMVCHGGSGSTLGALAAGVPLVVVPLFADQPINAERVEATGTGRRVDPGPELGQRVGVAVRDLVAERPKASARLAAEIAALPPADDAVPWLESLVAG